MCSNSTNEGFESESGRCSRFVVVDFNCMVILVMEPALRCVQQQTGESSGRESDGDCGCPTGRSVLSKSPPPPGWDETWRSLQILQETEEREKERRGKDEIVES